MNDKTQMTRERPARRQRFPLGTGDVLTAEQRPGFVRRYVNDKDDRVRRFVAAGYEPVHDPNADTSQGRSGRATNTGDSIVRKPVGGGVEAVLMEIPEEFYREDQAAKQSRVDMDEQAMQPRHGGTPNAQGQYGGVSIDRN